MTTWNRGAERITAMRTGILGQHMSLFYEPGDVELKTDQALTLLLLGAASKTRVGDAEEWFPISAMLVPTG